MQHLGKEQESLDSGGLKPLVLYVTNENKYIDVHYKARSINRNPDVVASLNGSLFCRYA